MSGKKSEVHFSAKSWYTILYYALSLTHVYNYVKEKKSFYKTVKDLSGYLYFCSKYLK